MARLFDTTAASDTVRLDNKGRGDAAFTVSNVSGRRVRGRAKVVPKDPATAGWVKIAGDIERDFPSGGTQQFTATVVVPPEARSGTYSFRLDVVSVDNPDEETAQGPSVSVTVAEAAPPPPKSLLIWFLLALGVLLIVAVGAIWFVLRTPAPANFAGSWSTNFARLELKQDGAKVTGEYRLHGSDDVVKVVGTAADRTLSGVLGDPAAKITFKVTLDPATHTFNGTWGANKPWCGVSAALASLPEGCSFTGQWTIVLDTMSLSAALTQVADKVTGTIDMGAPGHEKLGVNGELKGWVLEGELATSPRLPIRWTAVDQKFQQFYSIQYDLSKSDLSSPELGVNFDDACGFRQGASAPVPCRDPRGIVFGPFTLDGPPSTARTPGFEPNGPVKTIKVEGDFRATIIAKGVAARAGQVLAFGVRPDDRPDVWIRIGKSFWDDPPDHHRPYIITNSHGEEGSVVKGILDFEGSNIKAFAADEPVHFMIERRGDAIRIGFSRDGKTWESQRADNILGLNFWPAAEVEVYATAIGVKAEFSDFAVTRP